MARSQNRCRVPHMLPDSIMRAKYECQECERDVPKGWMHVVVPAYQGCLEVGLSCATDATGAPLLSADGLPMFMPVRARKP